MQQTYLNQTGVPLSVAVYLATDHYDYVPGAISATSLLKPIRQHILAKRIPPDQNKVDVLRVVKSRLGTSIHDGIEKAWSNGRFKAALRSLNYPEAVIDRVVVNPGYIEDPATGQMVKDPNAKPLAADAIPVYMEVRSFRELAGQTISGKFDFVAEGRVEDFKSTSTFTWVNQTKTEDYQLQGSIYRWLNPDIITEDYISIRFFFTDFMQGRVSQDPKYPRRQVETQNIPLLSLPDTEQYILSRLAQFDKYKNAKEEDIPECTDKELWRQDSVFKYYRDPNKTARSTKNFDTAYEAQARLAEDGHKGIVIEKPGTVKACEYCPAFIACKQKDRLIADGSLVI